MVSKSSVVLTNWCGSVAFFLIVGCQDVNKTDTTLTVQQTTNEGLESIHNINHDVSQSL